ncbi:MAG TPA: secretin N-terminal domain-containing protein [Acidiferrobacterales bacterium]|nr:secretin N-terminal domain-containing protein [Acidiferrobacterales bacterium]
MKPLVRQFLCAVLAGVFCCMPLLSHAIEAELRVITLKHRLAEEMLPVVRPLLAPGESVSGVDSRLVVRTTARTFAQIERLLSEIDRPRRNLRISVRHAGERERLQDNQGISGDARVGGARIIVTNGNHGTGGVTLGRSGQDGNVRLHTERRITTTRGTSTQTLTVQDGGRAFLRVGESIPQVQEFLVLIGNRPGVVTGVQYHDVTTGFEVEPRIVNETSFTERILLAVTPRLAFRGNQGTQSVSFQELLTVVTVKPGEWVDLGGLVESTNEVNRQILSTRRNSGSEDSRFLIRVDPQ